MASESGSMNSIVDDDESFEPPDHVAVTLYVYVLEVPAVNV